MLNNMVTVPDVKTWTEWTDFYEVFKPKVEKVSD